MRAELVHTVEQLCATDFGDWSMRAVLRAAATTPGWWTVKSTHAWTRIATPAGYLDFQRGKAGAPGPEYRGAQLSLPPHLHDAADFATLAAELARAGTPVPHRSTTVATGLRWQLPDRTLLLQRSSRLAWLELRPTRPVTNVVPVRDLERIERVARTVHDLGPGPWPPDGLEMAAAEQISVITLWEHRNRAAVAERGAIFGAVLDAVVGVIGGPTLYGGRSDGPEVRWRSANRTLILRGRVDEIRFEGHDTDTVERDESLEFEWGGTRFESDPHDFGDLPYLWQLDRNGPGDNPEWFPGGRPAQAMSHWHDALTLLFTALLEQLIPQVGAESLEFQILLPDETTRIAVSLGAGGLSVQLLHSDAGYATAPATVMRARGWQNPTWYGWATTFPAGAPECAVAAAALLVAEAQARGVRSPAELRRTDASCGGRGVLRLTGLGIGR
ncbi:hypothetical protein [Nocardia yamanashiensis]|uniref:hypothetical protein n=1 Tax=Nocardia yamanashiensis TaxID=209247 RepID=UPI0008320D1B|nr:hypothetical protein [Nocardia yamanashiensis]